MSNAISQVLTPSDLEAFCLSLPKIDLHCHLEGAIYPEAARELQRYFQAQQFPAG